MRNSIFLFALLWEFAHTSTAASIVSEQRWFPLGCYNSSVRRLMLNGELQNNRMNYAICQDYCRQRPAMSNSLFIIIGLTNGSICSCGLTIQGGSIVRDRDCGQKCLGNDEQLCGGSAATIAFNVTAKGQPHQTFGRAPAELDSKRVLTISSRKSIISVSLTGCYKTNLDGGVLTKGAYRISPVTPESCLRKCKSIFDKIENSNSRASYQFFYGLSHAKYCFCDRKLNKPKKLHLEKCMWPCPNEAANYCGTSVGTIVYIATVRKQPSSRDSNSAQYDQDESDDIVQKLSITSKQMFNFTQNSSLGRDQVTMDVLEYHLIVRDESEEKNQQDDVNNKIVDGQIIGMEASDGGNSTTRSLIKSNGIREIVSSLVNATGLSNSFSAKIHGE